MDAPLWFRFGDGYLELASADAAFAARFLDLYLECVTAPPAAGDGPRVRCRIGYGAEPGRTEIAFDDPEPLDQVPLALPVLAGAGFTERPGAAPPWRILASPVHGGVMAFDGPTIRADEGCPWQSVVASLALHRVLRLQRDHFFFHAASLALGARGVLLMGPKESGKTTLALALAARGHAFLGDEIAALRRDALQLLPFRRRLSLRPGPAAASARRVMRETGRERIRLPDGTTRTFVQPSAIVPGPPPAAVPLGAIVFIGARGRAPRITRFAPAAADVRLLAPFESVRWGRSPADAAFGLLQLLTRVHCYHLEPGSVGRTARLLESTLVEA